RIGRRSTGGSLAGGTDSGGSSTGGSNTGGSGESSTGGSNSGGSSSGGSGSGGSGSGSGGAGTGGGSQECTLGTPPSQHQETIDITWTEMTGGFAGLTAARNVNSGIQNFRNFIWDQIL